MKISHLSIFLFSSLFVILCTDISRDYAYISGIEMRNIVPGLQPYVDGAMMAIVSILICLGIIVLLLKNGHTNIPRGPLNFLLSLAAIYIYGAIVGILHENSRIYVLGEFQNLVIYWSVFAIGCVAVNDKMLWTMYKAFFIGCGVMIIKAVASSIIEYSSHVGYFRVLLKGSGYFQIMTILSFALFAESKIKKERIKFFLIMLLGLFGVLVSYHRGFFLGLFGGLMFYAIFMPGSGRGIRYLSRMVITLIPIALIWSLVSHQPVSTIFGRWSGNEQYGFQEGVDYRVYQSKMLIDKFKDHFIVGNGLGSYLGSDYEGNYLEGVEVSKPYIVELDLLNYTMKFGMVASTLLWGSFVYLMALGVKASKRATQSMYKALPVAGAASLFSLLIASGTNATYSGIMFHLFTALYLLTLIAARTAECHSFTNYLPKENLIQAPIKYV